MNFQNTRALRKQEDGASLVETAVLLPVFLLILVGAIDFGRAYYAAIEVAAAAQAGALYGAQNSTDTAGMVAASKLEVADVSGFSASASYGCECSDGSSPVVSCGSAPSCAYNVVNYVQVTATSNYTTLLTYPGLAHTLSLSSKARMRAAH